MRGICLNVSFKMILVTWITYILEEEKEEKRNEEKKNTLFGNF